MQLLACWRSVFESLVALSSGRMLAVSDQSSSCKRATKRSQSAVRNCHTSHLMVSTSGTGSGVHTSTILSSVIFPPHCISYRRLTTCQWFGTFRASRMEHPVTFQCLTAARLRKYGGRCGAARSRRARRQTGGHGIQRSLRWLCASLPLEHRAQHIRGAPV